MPVDGADLCAVVDTQRLGEGCAAVGIDGGVGSGAADGDIGGTGIDDVDAERFEVGDDALGRGALGAMDGADPTEADVAIGEVAQVEHLALAVVGREPEAGPLRIDRHDGRDLAVEPLGAPRAG